MSAVRHSRAVEAHSRGTASRTHPSGRGSLAPLSVYPTRERCRRAPRALGWFGYPRGLKGEVIPLAARRPSPTADAITYRRRHSHARSRRSRSAITAGRGTQFDPELVDLFLTRPAQVRIKGTARGEHARKKRSANRRRGVTVRPTSLPMRPRSLGAAASGSSAIRIALMTATPAAPATVIWRTVGGYSPDRQRDARRGRESLEPSTPTLSRRRS
jgi:hypothetical protein